MAFSLLTCICIILYLCSRAHPANSRALYAVVQNVYYSSNDDQTNDEYKEAVAEASYREAIAEAMYYLQAFTHSSTSSSQIRYAESVETAHERWMAKFKRRYSNDNEKKKRQMIFQQNFEYIEEFNKQEGNSYTLGLNQFADLTTDEFFESHTGFKISRSEAPGTTPIFSPFETASFDDEDREAPEAPEIPDSVDWRQKGAVSHIKNQDRCVLDGSSEDGTYNGSNILCGHLAFPSVQGSWWAFSTIAAVEGIVQIKTGKLRPLSEQQLVDCTEENDDDDNNDEDIMNEGFKYIMKNKGVASEADYPYQGQEGECDTEKASKPAAKIKGFKNVSPDSDEKLLQAVATQPVSAAIAIPISDDFRFYEGGIYNESCGDSLNLGVTVIGYGSEDGQKYWLIKNSWGDTWGDHGYMKLFRDDDSLQGHCGINMRASYPTF